MNSAKKGDWVKVHNIVLTPSMRAPQVPEDTKKVPLEMWVKGFLLDDRANIGDKVMIETYIERKVEGTLVAISPSYNHGFGNDVAELKFIGRQLRDLLEGGEVSV